MSVSFTYLQFHLAFLLPAVMLLFVTGFVSRTRITDTAAQWTHGWRRYWLGVGIITVAALLYTTPWDNLLIARGVWWYGEDRTLATVWEAPIEEYLFIAIQPWLTALWLSHLSFSTEWPAANRPRASRAAMVVVAAAIGVAGWRWLGTDATFYIGAIFAWAAPVLALQWAVGAPQLWARRRTVAIGTLVPTLYLCIADRIAIEYGIWILSERYTTGIFVGGLPIEEAAFFFVTNLFVVQGLVLYRLVTARWGIEALTGWIDRHRTDSGVERPGA